MATKLYLHSANSTVSGTLPGSTQSGLTINGQVDNPATSIRSMDRKIGTSQTSLVLTSNATVSAQNYFFARFISPPLNVTSIAANTWTYRYAGSESNASANFTHTSSGTEYMCVYVWRPSTGAKVADILNGQATSNVAEVSTTETDVGPSNFTGAAVTCAVGDVIVFELIAKVTQGAATAFTDTYYYDGTTEGSTTTAASYINTPQDIFFTTDTKLYLHAATSTVSGTLPSTDQSSLTPDSIHADPLTTNRSMDTTIGTSQATLSISTAANISAHNYYFSRFVSPPLNQTSVAANTWYYNFAASQSNTLANFPTSSGGNKPIYITCYVWRPGTGAKVSNIIDANSASVYSSATGTTEVSYTGTFTGSAVSCAVGDVIIFEAWFQITQATGTSYTDSFYYDGTTETLTSLTSVSNHAAFILTPETVSFQTGGVLTTRNVSETITLTESILRNAVRKPTETLALTESIKRTAVRKKSETLALAESIRRTAVRRNSESLTLTESLKRKILRKLSETLTLTELLSAVAIFIEHLNLTEQVRINVTRRVTESLLLSESVSLRTILTRHISESLHLVESLTRKIVRKKTETLVLTETRLRKAIPKVAGEGLVLSEWRCAYYDPLYIYPDWYNGPSYGWLPIINAIAAFPNTQFVLTINVNSGPDTAQNSDYVHGISDLKTGHPNVKIIGYIGTLYGAKTVADVETEVDRWFSFYPNIDGVMLDEMDNVLGAHEAYYTSITNYVHNKGYPIVFGNPGTATISSYVPTVDTILIYEDIGLPSISTVNTRTFNGAYYRNKFGIVARGISTLDPSFIRQASRDVGYMFLSDGSGYGTLPSYLTDELKCFYGVLRNVTRNLSESISLVEAIIRKIVRQLSDTLTLTESSIIRKIRRVVTEVLQLVESVTATLTAGGLVITVNETIQLSESVLRNAIRRPAESLHLTETILRRAIMKIAETLHLTETILRRPVPKVTGETLHLTETILRRPIMRIAETLHLTEVINRTAHFNRTDSETLHLAESIRRTAIRSIITETLHLTEVINRSAHFNRSLSESIHLTESILRNAIHKVAETLHLAETINRKLRHSIVESLHLTETILRNARPKISVPETLHLAENIIATKFKLFRVIVNESLKLTESFYVFARIGGIGVKKFKRTIADISGIFRPGMEG